jgi:hypothetical protein
VCHASSDICLVILRTYWPSYVVCPVLSSLGIAGEDSYEGGSPAHKKQKGEPSEPRPRVLDPPPGPKPLNSVPDPEAKNEEKEEEERRGGEGQQGGGEGQQGGGQGQQGGLEGEQGQQGGEGEGQGGQGQGGEGQGGQGQGQQGGEGEEEGEGDGGFTTPVRLPPQQPPVAPRGPHYQNPGVQRDPETPDQSAEEEEETSSEVRALGSPRRWLHMVVMVTYVWIPLHMVDMSLITNVLYLPPVAPFIVEPLFDRAVACIALFRRAKAVRLRPDQR